MRYIVINIMLLFGTIFMYGSDVYMPFSNELPSQYNNPYKYSINSNHYRGNSNRVNNYYNRGNNNSHINKSVSRDNGIDPTTGKGGYKEKTTSDGYTIYYQKGNSKNPTEIWIIDSNGNVINIDAEDMDAFFSDASYRESLINGSEKTYDEYVNGLPLCDEYILLIFLLLYCIRYRVYN